MPHDSLKIKVEQDTVAARAARARRSGFPLLLSLGIAAVALAFMGSIALWPAPDESLDIEKEGSLSLAAPESEESPTEVISATDDLVIADDGQTQWVSPTSGMPIELSYLPLGTQMVLHLRPADVAAHGEGEKIFAAMGPWGIQADGAIEKLTGARLAEIESMVIAVRPVVSGGLETTLRLQLAERWSEDELAERLPESRAAQRGGQVVRETASRVAYLPRDTDGAVLVACPNSALADLLQQGDAPALFPRDMQRLLQRTDRDRMASLVFPTKFLQINGEKFLPGLAEPLVHAFHALLGHDAAAVAWSIHWDDNFFLELRSTVILNRRPHAFAAALEQHLHTTPDHVENRVRIAPLHPYGHKVVTRFPEMLRKMSTYTRSSEEEGLSVTRCYLPLAAGHNLLMAAELLLSRPGGAAGQQQVADTQHKPQTVADQLETVTSLVFPKDTLERALEILAEDIRVSIEIAGGDLQLEGITKNQSFALDLREQPAREILLAIVSKANPDRSVSGPGDQRQKLVYVIREANDSQLGGIVVTTRAAAAKRGEKLPSVFQPGNR